MCTALVAPIGHHDLGRVSWLKVRGSSGNILGDSVEQVFVAAADHGERVQQVCHVTGLERGQLGGGFFCYLGGGAFCNRFKLGFHKVSAMRCGT